MTEAPTPSKRDSAGASVLLKKNPEGKTQMRKSKQTVKKAWSTYSNYDYSLLKHLKIGR